MESSTGKIATIVLLDGKALQYLKERKQDLFCKLESSFNLSAHKPLLQVRSNILAVEGNVLLPSKKLNILMLRILSILTIQYLRQFLNLKSYKIQQLKSKLLLILRQYFYWSLFRTTTLVIQNCIYDRHIMFQVQFLCVLIVIWSIAFQFRKRLKLNNDAQCFTWTIASPQNSITKTDYSRRRAALDCWKVSHSVISKRVFLQLIVSLIVCQVLSSKLPRLPRSFPNKRF